MAKLNGGNSLINRPPRCNLHNEEVDGDKVDRDELVLPPLLLDFEINFFDMVSVQALLDIIVAVDFVFDFYHQKHSILCPHSN